MNSKISKKTIIYIILTIALVAGLIFILKTNKKKTDEKVYQYDKSQPLLVETQLLKNQEIGDDFSFSGSFEPNKETKLSAETQGKINTILCDVGSQVASGQKLVQLDVALLQQQLSAIEVQIRNAKAEFTTQLRANQIQIDGFRKDVKRYTVLAQADAVQGIQLEKAQIQLQTTENQRQAILNQSGIKTAEAQRQNILVQLNKTTIKAPFSGVITAKLSEVGGFAAPGVPILQLTDIQNLKFTINISDQDLKKFAIGQSYSVLVDAFPNEKLNGRVIMVGSKSNMGSSFPVQFLVRNTPDNLVKAGMFGKVKIDSNTDEKGIVIPAKALIGSNEKPQVYIVKNGKANLIDVEISKRTSNKIVISNGLKEGDLLITNGFINLFNGANVKTK